MSSINHGKNNNNIPLDPNQRKSNTKSERTHQPQPHVGDSYTSVPYQRVLVKVEPSKPRPSLTLEKVLESLDRSKTKKLANTAPSTTNQSKPKTKSTRMPKTQSHVGDSDTSVPGKRVSEKVETSKPHQTLTLEQISESSHRHDIKYLTDTAIDQAKALNSNNPLSTSDLVRYTNRLKNSKIVEEALKQSTHEEKDITDEQRKLLNQGATKPTTEPKKENSFYAEIKNRG